MIKSPIRKIVYCWTFYYKFKYCGINNSFKVTLLEFDKEILTLRMNIQL